MNFIFLCIACRSVQCPNGSRCRVWNGTRLTYCEYSCDIDNGGCANESQCEEVDVPTCSPGQCCSRVNVTCVAPDQRTYAYVIIMSVCIATINIWLANVAYRRVRDQFHIIKSRKTGQKYKSWYEIYL